jgi:hypothetical protein
MSHGDELGMPGNDKLQDRADDVFALQSVSVYRGVRLPAHRVAEATATLRQMGPLLEQLRAVSLRYLPDVLEPATATAWIESGGRSWQTSPR